MKSNRSTPTPCAASPPAMRRAASPSLPQVKQWAKSANARTGPAGKSSRAANSWPLPPINVALMVDAVMLMDLHSDADQGQRSSPPPPTRPTRNVR